MTIPDRDMMMERMQEILEIDRYDEVINVRIEDDYYRVMERKIIENENPLNRIVKYRFTVLDSDGYVKSEYTHSFGEQR